MSSGKKRSLKKCTKCKLPLNKINWKKHDQKSGHYICNTCRKKYDCIRHQGDIKYIKKQRDRYRERRSAVIFHYGNQCAKCSEDDYTKLSISSTQNGRVDINYLYNNLIDKDGYQVHCYNCLAIAPKDKYTLRNKKLLVKHYGSCCVECQEDRLERLTMKMKPQIFCLNCYHSKIAAIELEEEVISLRASMH